MKWLAAILTWFAADPQAIDTERPRAAACVMAAHASMAKKGGADAAKNTNADAALGEPGAGFAAEARHNGKATAGQPLHKPAAPKMAAGCADGRCVRVQTVRPSGRQQSR